MAPAGSIIRCRCGKIPVGIQPAISPSVVQREMAPGRPRMWAPPVGRNGRSHFPMKKPLNRERPNDANCRAGVDRLLVRCFSGDAGTAGFVRAAEETVTMSGRPMIDEIGPDDLVAAVSLERPEGTFRIADDPEARKLFAQFGADVHMTGRMNRGRDGQPVLYMLQCRLRSRISTAQEPQPN